MVQKHPWEETRERGMWRYVLLHGLVFSAWMLVFDFIFARDFLISHMVAILLFGGPVYGFWR